MIHPLSSVHPGARLGENVTIEAFTSISEDVVIGDHTWIGPNATIMNGARIGAHCRIFPGAVVAGAPQDLKYAGEASTVTIGDHTVIRECVTVNKGTRLDRNDTRLGSHCVIMAYTHVAHDCIIADHVILANSVQMAGHVHIGEHAFIGGTAAIHQYVKIGAHAMISGGTLVRKDVPPYITAAREPLAYCGINSTGLRRRGFSPEKINEIQDIYRMYYLSGYNSSDALDRIKLELNPSAERDEIIRFIEASSRGIIRKLNEQL